jgi:hypothetical protein
MENHYEIKGDVAIVDVPYKDTIVRVTIDKEDIDMVSAIHGRWILTYKDSKRTYFYFVCNLDKSISLHKLLLQANNTDKVFIKDKDHTNLRKDNLTLNSYEVDDALRELKRKSYKNMSDEGKLNLLEGIRMNRYSKDWSDKLATHKKGKKNPNTVLNVNKVREIREDYALRKFTQQALADKYGVGRTTIADIVNYRTWNEIGEDPKKTYRIYVESQVIPIVLKETPIQEYTFTNADIWLKDFVIELQGKKSAEFIFCQKIGDIKLYVEVRDTKKEFLHSFEVVFPEYLTSQHIHNYVITQRKPVRYLNRHEIHHYMNIISTYLFGDSYEKEEEATMRG